MLAIFNLGVPELLILGLLLLGGVVAVTVVLVVTLSQKRHREDRD
jgi:hypothetical protein